MTNTYYELKEKQQQEYNNFAEKNMFYAFDEKQFEQGLKKLKVSKTTMKQKLCSIGCGGFMLKSTRNELEILFDKHHKEMQERINTDKKGNGFIKDMFAYELANHEYGYTMDLTDTLNCLGLTEKAIENSKNLSKGLALALKQYRLHK